MRKSKPRKWTESRKRLFLSLRRTLDPYAVTERFGYKNPASMRRMAWTLGIKLQEPNQKWTPEEIARLQFKPAELKRSRSAINHKRQRLLNAQTPQRPQTLSPRQGEDHM